LARDFFRDFEKLSPQQRLLHLDSLRRWHSGDVRFRQRLSRRWEFIQARVQALAAVGRPKEAVEAMQAGYESDLAVVQQTLMNQGDYQEGKEAYEQALEILKNGRYCLSSLGLSQSVWKTELLQQFKQRYP
jgi:tetratricopeptide (TPR) repeat protein